MERRRRIALFAVLFALAAIGAVLISHGARSPQEAPGGDVAPLLMTVPAPEPGPVPGRARGSRREDREPGEEPPTLAVIEASRAGRSEALPVVERFLGAYLDYEVGRLGAGVRRTLRSTSTPAFARELLASPVRAPLGVRVPARARVVRVEVYLAPAAPRGTATAVLTRAGKRHRSTFLLARGPRGWRVAGLP
jgi:hypothetical protein